MRIKELKFGKDARHSILNGMTQVHDAVACTIGPKGNNGVIWNRIGVPVNTNDGVTIAKEIVLSDRFEDIGAKLIQEVAIKTNNVAGDGTTTATILVYAIIVNALKYLEEEGTKLKAAILRRYLEKWVNEVIKFLDEHKEVITTQTDRLRAIATISAQDEQMGQAIAEAIEKVGQYGIIAIDEGLNEKEVEHVFVEGLDLEAGYVSEIFANNKERRTCELKDAFIFITNHSIVHPAQIAGLIDRNVGKGGKLIILAEGFSSMVVDFYDKVQKMGLGMEFLLIKNPFTLKKAQDFCEDLAVITGSKFVNKNLPMEADLTLYCQDLANNPLGKVSQTTATASKSTFIMDEVDTEALNAKVEEINALVEAATTDYEKEVLKERVAKLTQSVCIMKVGAVTEVELKEKKYKLEDAINATKAAVEDGIVPGGGIALLRASEYLAGLPVDSREDGADSTAKTIILEAILLPFQRIVENAVGDYTGIYEQVANKDFAIGYDAKNDRIVNLLEANIIDPVKATKSGLKNEACQTRIKVCVFAITKLIIIGVKTIFTK